MMKINNIKIHFSLDTACERNYFLDGYDRADWLGRNTDKGRIIAKNSENRAYDILMDRLFSTVFLPIACEKYLMISNKVNSCFY